MLSIVLSVLGLGFFCCLLFALAIYALPFLVGLTAGLAVFDNGGGVIGAILIGLFVSGAILALGQIVIAANRTPLIRFIIGLLYAVPASIAGYQVAFALAGVGMFVGGWQTVFAAAGAAFSGATAFSRMTLFIPASYERDVEGAHAPIGWRPHDQRR